jgi:prepilin-type N-terminal cleavage/methylation domain-containing protein
MSRNSRTPGFTLVELMVGVFILSVVTIQMMSMLDSQHEAYVEQEDTVEAQEDIRLVASFMLSDLRMAGYMVPRIAGISSRDGGAGGSDVVCVSDSSVINDTILLTANGHSDRASVTADVGGNDNTVTVVAGELDIDEDGDTDFIVGRGIIIADGAASHCAAITIVNVGGNTLTFAPATPAGFTAPAAGVRVVPARIYSLGGNGLRRDTSTLSTLVEDIQVEFGVDSNDNGQLDGGEFPIHDLSGFDPALIRSVRLSLISRTPTADSTQLGPGRPAAANRTAGAVDGFRRRTVIATAYPRNLQ